LSANGVTLLFVSHDIETVRKICSEALYLSRGIMLSFGAAKHVCMDYERDLFGASKAAEASSGSDEPDAPGLEDGTLDPELLNTNEKTYGDGRAQILDVVITNKHRKKINVLEPGADLIVSYRASFLAPADRPIFGMMITNREGVCVFGTNTACHRLSSRHYTVGDEVSVEFHLTNNLGPGVYYLTCGIHSSESNDGLIYLQRRMDVMILKSVMHDDMIVGGTANLHPRIGGVDDEERAQ
jgi:lipopolysaccharide transport system ATP-binding protein